MADEQLPVELAPAFQALKPEEQATVRAAWQAKFAALQPAERTVVMDAWRKKYAAPDTGTALQLDERGQPIARTGALPPGAVEDVEATLPGKKKSFAEHMQEPNRPLMEAAKKIQNPVLGGAAEFGAEQITPANLVLMGGLSKLPETAGRAALGAFSAMALKAMYHEAPEAYQLWQSGDKMGALRVLTKMGLSTIVAALGGKATAEGLAADVAGAHAPQPHGPTAADYEAAPLGVTAEEMQAPPPAAPPPPAPPPAEPAPVPGSLDDLDLKAIGRQPPPGSMDINVPAEPTAEQMRAQAGLQGLELEGGQTPLAYEEGGPPAGPKPAQEPTETVPSDLMNAAPEARQDLIPDQLIGQPEPGIEPPPESIPYTPEPAPEQATQLPADLTGQPEPGIEAELARQEAKLDGQTKAAKAIRRAMPNSDAATAIEQQAVETARKVQGLRRAVEHEKAANEPPTVQNPPAAPANEARLRSELLMRNVDADNPQAVMEHVKDTLGLKKPAQVTTTGVYPVSKSSETPTRYEADLSAPVRPSKVLHEGDHMAEAEGGPKPPEGPGANDAIVNRYLAKNNMSDRVVGVNKALQDAADAYEGPTREQMGIAAGAADRIKEGAMGRETRTEFREAGPKPETDEVGVSRAEVLDLKGRVGDSLNEALRLSRDIIDQGDPTSRLAGKAAYAQAKRLVKEFAVASRAASRALSAFQLPAEMARRMRELGLTLNELRDVKLREPLLNEIAQTARGWAKGDLSRAEAAPVILRDVVDTFRYGLFQPFSFMLHVMFSDVPFQVARSAGMDAARAVQGDATAPNLRAWVYALADRVPGIIGKAAELDPRIEQALGEKTASGEITRGGFGGTRGTFLRRGPATLKGGASLRGVGEAAATTADYAMGAPLYAKVALDRAAGNLAAEATLWAEALKRTPKELEGEAARNWRRDFVDHSAPDDVMELAVENAKKAKFNRPLSKFEERVAGSTTYRLLVDIFARWPFQATRAMGEWFGYDPKIFAKIKAGTLSSEELAGYLAKTATGLGGLTLLNQLVYPNVDFNSMEYVHRDQHGNETGRTRMVEPVPAAMVLLGMGRAVANFGMGDKEEAQRDLEAAHHSLQYASLPFAKLAGALSGAGELGGVLSSALGWLAHGGQDRQKAMDPNGLRRAFIDQVNRLLPGQAVLAAIKQVMDPVEREGIGARLPMVSEALPQRPNRTQGGPMIRTRELPLGAGEASLSANMPGSTRKMDPVEAMLMRYGEPVYRGPRTPVAGVPAAEIPDDLKAEWEEELGIARQYLLGPLAHRLALQGNDLEQLGPERARALVRSMDSKAAALATKMVTARHDPQPKPFRRESLQEMVGPEERHLGYLKSKADREAAQKAAQ